MKHVFLILFLTLPQFAMAQEADVEPYAECAEILASAPANQLAKMSEDGTYGKIEDILEPILLGKMCSVNQIIKFMGSLGWEIESYRTKQFTPPFSNHQFTGDLVTHFCLPEKGFWRFLSKCRGGATIYFFQNRVTWIAFGAPIRFGG